MLSICCILNAHTFLSRYYQKHKVYATLPPKLETPDFEDPALKLAPEEPKLAPELPKLAPELPKLPDPEDDE